MISGISLELCETHEFCILYCKGDSSYTIGLISIVISQTHIFATAFDERSRNVMTWCKNYQVIILILFRDFAFQSNAYRGPAL